MLDIKFVRNNPDVVKQNIKNKFQDEKLPLVDEVIELDKRNREIKQEVEALRAEKNKASKEIGAMMAQKKIEEAEALKKKVAESNGRINELSEEEKEVEEKLNQVTEFVRIIQEEDGFPDQFFFDVRSSLKRVRIEGMYLDEQELFDLRRSLETIRDIVRFLHRNEDEEENNTPYPSLKRLAGDIAVFPQLIGKIDGILNKYGKIKDNASTELARIRRELASTMGNI